MTARLTPKRIRDQQDFNATPGSGNDGYAVVYDHGAVPQIYKQAIELLAGHYYENREQVIAMPGVTIAELPLGVQSLLMIDRGAF